jgi:hypothetical protein
LGSRERLVDGMAGIMAETEREGKRVGEFFNYPTTGGLSKKMPTLV